jgi:hypothetical protein
MPIGGALRALGRFGTDVTRGLSQASNRLPQAMETRMRLMGQRQEQARARALQAWQLAPGAETWQGLVDSGVIDPHSEVPIEDQIATVEAPEAPLPEEFLPEIKPEKLPYQILPERETLEGIVREEVDRGREIDPGFYIGEGQPESPGQRLIRPPVDEPPPGQDPRLTQWLGQRDKDLERQALEDERAEDLHAWQAQREIWDREKALRDKEKHERDMYGWHFNTDGSGVRHIKGGGYERIEAPSKMDKIYPDAGYWVDQYGVSHELDEGLREALEGVAAAEGKEPFAADFKNGFYLDKEGNIHSFGQEWMDANEARLDEVERRKEEAQEHSYALKREYQLEQDAQKLAEWGSKKIYDLFKEVNSRVADKGDTPAAATSYFQKQLDNLPGITEVDKESLVEVARSHAVRQAMNIHRHFSAFDDKALTAGTTRQVQADKLLALLGNEEVREEVGRVSGTIDEILAKLTGEKGRSKDLVRFTMILDDLKDGVQRERSGAVLNESEKVFYNRMLGSTYTSPAALEARLETLIEIMQDRRDAIWEGALNESFGSPEAWRAEGAEIPQYERRHGRGRVRTNISDEDME